MKTMNNNQEKIELNTCFDLYKLPINVLKNTKIYNFKGKYFDKIYEEALKIEKSGTLTHKQDIKKQINFYKIEFEIFYLTEFGQRIKLLGSIDELGKWSAHSSGGLNLTWNKGNIWKGEIPFREKFEFKYVFLQNENIVKWESGENRSFDINTIRDSISADKLDKDGKIIINKGTNLYEYDQNTGTIIIKCIWRNQ